MLKRMFFFLNLFIRFLNLMERILGWVEVHSLPSTKELTSEAYFFWGTFCNSNICGLTDNVMSPYI